MARPSTFRCTFYVRRLIESGYRYSMVGLPGPGFHTHLPPSVGDVIYLQGTGMVKVLGRQFLPASWGSQAWNRADESPPTAVDIVVEPTEGLFADEAPLTEEEKARG